MIQAIELQVISKILSYSDEEDIVDTLMAFDPDTYFSAYLNEIKYIHSQRETYDLIPSIFDFQAQFPEFNIVQVPEPVDYLVVRLKEYRQYLLLIETFNKVKDLGEGDVKDAWAYIGLKAEEATMFSDSNPMDIVKEADLRAEQIKEYAKQERIPTGFPEIDRVMYGGLSTVEELLVLIARTNAGKAQPLWAPVLTPTGWTTMGELKIGDMVVGKNNDNGKVQKIFPQGVIDYYEVSFDDGTKVECCADHLWEIINEDGTYSVITCDEIRKGLEHRSYAVELTSSVELDVEELTVQEKLAFLLKEVLKVSKETLRVCKIIDEKSANDLANTCRSLGMWVNIIPVVNSTKCLIDIDRTRSVKKIESIDFKGKTECQCILLDNESHTYITTDYTVTHNSWVCTRMMESAQSHGFPVAYYSPEMQAAYLGTRFDTWRGHFENNKLFKGDYSQEYYAYMKSLKEEETSAFVIEDKDFPDGVSIRTLDPFVKKHGIKLLIIDGISYMNDDRKATRDQEKYKNIAMGLFTLSKKYGCAVVLVMQANREVKSKDDKGEAIPSLYNAEGSDQPARIATQAFGVRQIFDKHVLDIGLLKSRMADNRTPVFSYAWDINTGQTQYIPADTSDDSSVSVSPSPQVSTPSISFGSSQPDSSDLSLLDDEDDDMIEF